MAEKSDPVLMNALKAGDAAAAATLAADADLLPARAQAAGQWWAGGFHTRQVAPEVSRLLVDHGAPLSVHAAAGLGLMEELAAMLAADPSLVDAKGGDGCTPLHFSRNTAIAGLLLDHGARIDARDDDHESTPAQWLIGEAPEVTRFLLDHGATPDIFMAAGLGERGLAERLILADPGFVAQRIGRAPDFPPIGHKGRGGTIYQWTLAFNSYPHQVALLKGHTELFDFLYEKSDTTTQFLVSCVLARRSEAEAIAARNPDLVAGLQDEDLQLLAKYCWETNSNYEAVKLMLDLGFPVAHPEHSHGYTPLHNAAWEGRADIVDLLLERGAPVDIEDPCYHATPLGFALHDCLVEKRHPEGQFGPVVKSLIAAGSPWDRSIYPTGDARIDEVLEPLLRR